MKDKAILASYERAKDVYAELGVDTEKAMAFFQTIPVSLHNWQADDVRGFEGSEGIHSENVVTGNYPGRATNGDQMRQDYEMAFKYSPAKHKVNLHCMYAEPKHAKERCDLDTEDFLIVVSSTYGEGELPSGALPFADELDDVKPDLSGMRFAVFGMGDSVYDDTFNRGGEIMAEMLTKLGATQVGEHHRHDASSTIKPTVAASEWAEGLKSVIAQG